MKFLRYLALMLVFVLLMGCVACGANQNSTAIDVYEDMDEEETDESGSTASGGDTTAENATADGTTAQNGAQSTTAVNGSAQSQSTTGGKNIVTHTTGENATSTTKDKTSGKSIKILAIGNSFSVDAMNGHLYEILASAGYTDITLGNLYIGGCSLDTHYANLKSNAAAYTYYLNTDGEWTKRDGIPASTAFGTAHWDVVTIQQVSTDSGRAHAYGNLQKTLDLIKQKEPRAKIYWHMTWAYQQNSDHWAFGYYNNDQKTMYDAIVSTVRDTVMTNSAISGLIPAGTAIQNLRTSGLGDTLTSDGHHLEDVYGDYTAALTWFCAITGENPEVVTYRPAKMNGYEKAIVQAVKNAIKKPYAVTAV